MYPQKNEVNTGAAYFLWAIGFCFPIFGLHRFYLGKPVSGTIYLLTLGGLYIGQFLDAFFIPGMVRNRNRYLWENAQFQPSTTQVFHSPPQVNLSASAPQPSTKDPMIKLLQAASKHHNQLSVAQVMISLEISHEDAEKLLIKALKQGLAHIDNDPDSGAVRYYFDI